VQFLWSLLPGAREARNQVLIGYAWLAVLALWFGVPEVSGNQNLQELVDAIGRVGVGIAVSFGAFMLGSFIEDLTSPLFHTRSAKGFTSGSIGGIELLEAMEEVGRNELARLEGSIDRASSELSLRVGLLVPLVLGVMVVQPSAWWWYLILAAIVVALIFQITVRQLELRNDLVGSNELRGGAIDKLVQSQVATVAHAEQVARNERNLSPGSSADSSDSHRAWSDAEQRLKILTAEQAQTERERDRLLETRGLGRLLLLSTRMSDRYAPDLRGRWVTD
jgi:hypothetical protein